MGKKEERWVEEEGKYYSRRALCCVVVILCYRSVASVINGYIVFLLHITFNNIVCFMLCYRMYIIIIKYFMFYRILKN